MYHSDEARPMNYHIELYFITRDYYNTWLYYYNMLHRIILALFATVYLIYLGWPFFIMIHYGMNHVPHVNNEE